MVRTSAAAVSGVKSFPAVTIVPISYMGVPAGWQENPLWAKN